MNSIATAAIGNYRCNERKGTSRKAPLPSRESLGTLVGYNQSLRHQHDRVYYLQCLAGGVLASTIRWIQVPLDVVKVNMQISPHKYSSNSLLRGLQTLWKEEGVAGMFKGWGPTAMACAIQTGGKLSLYEICKDQLTSVGRSGFGNGAHESNGVAVHALHPTVIYTLSAITAEAISDVFMCPWEVRKVRIQSAPVSAEPCGKPAFSMQALYRIWARQVPSTLINMNVFEGAVKMIYDHILNDRPKSAYSTSTQLCVTVTAGYMAGCASAVVSHPADVLLSLSTLPKHQGKTVLQLVNELGGIRPLYAGLTPRVLMVGFTISGQWLLYDSFKTALGLGTSGGIKLPQQ